LKALLSRNSREEFIGFRELQTAAKEVSGRVEVTGPGSHNFWAQDDPMPSLEIGARPG